MVVWNTSSVLSLYVLQENAISVFLLHNSMVNSMC